MKQLIHYFKNIFEARYFWAYLATSDLKSKWRRSFFGILWSILQPLGMAILLSLVFSRLFKMEITHYLPYIFSGVVIWEFIVTTVTGSALSFVQSASYIKQCKHPLAIYTLRNVLSALIVLMLATTPLLIWALIVMPENFNFSWIAILSLYPIALFIFWPLATCTAYIGARFRDLSPALTLIMQALWFISPVYFEEKMFRAGGLNWLVDYNPVYHLLQIVRAPILTGHFPTLHNYGFCLLTALICSILAILIGIRAERKVIFYI